MFRQQVISALIVTDPREAARRIEEAYRRAGCNLKVAAEVLGCGYRTVHKWIDRLGLKERLERIRRAAEREGWAHAGAVGNRGGGRPRVAKARPRTKAPRAAAARA